MSRGRQVEGVGGGREERGTDIEKLQKSGRQIWIHYDRWWKEIRVIAYTDLAIIKFWYLIGYFL